MKRASRRQAQEAFTTKQDGARNDAGDKLPKAEDAKTAGLKTMRLAEETTDNALATTSKRRAKRPAERRTPRIV